MIRSGNIDRNPLWETLNIRSFPPHWRHSVVNWRRSSLLVHMPSRRWLVMFPFFSFWRQFGKLPRWNPHTLPNSTSKAEAIGGVWKQTTFANGVDFSLCKLADSSVSLQRVEKRSCSLLSFSKHTNQAHLWSATQGADPWVCGHEFVHAGASCQRWAKRGIHYRAGHLSATEWRHHASLPIAVLLVTPLQMFSLCNVGGGDGFRRARERDRNELASAGDAFKRHTTEIPCFVQFYF